jgi:predicted Zn-dependent protease
VSQAEENFRSAVAILEYLARFDPNNTDWQRSVAQSYEQLAAMLGRQALAAAVVGTSSSLTAAFSETVLYYGKSLAVRKMLTAKDPETFFGRGFGGGILI